VGVVLDVVRREEHLTAGGLGAGIAERRKGGKRVGFTVRDQDPSEPGPA